VAQSAPAANIIAVTKSFKAVQRGREGMKDQQKISAGMGAFSKRRIYFSCEEWRPRLEITVDA
jgi:hypothetical protein